jgi:hypothetical protein
MKEGAYVAYSFIAERIEGEEESSKKGVALAV